MLFGRVARFIEEKRDEGRVKTKETFDVRTLKEKEEEKSERKRG